MASLNLPRLVVVAVHSSAILAAAAATAGNSSVLPLPSPPVTDNSSSSTDNSSVPASFRPSIAVIVGVLTTMFSLTFLLLIYAKHCKRSPVGVFGPDDLPMMPQQLVFRTDCGIDPAVVEALPTFSFSSLKGNKEGLECAVCLSKYEDQELLRLLPKCKHAFHVDCVDTWLASHSTCPLCRHCVSSEDVFIVDEMMLMLSSRRRSMDHPIPGPPLPEPPLHGGGSRSSLDIEMGPEFQIYVHREFEENANPQQDRDENALVEAEKQQQGIDHQAASTGSTRRLGHRIIVSDVVLQRRWSDLVPSDVLFLGSSHTLFWPSDRVHTTGIGLSRSSSSSSRCKPVAAQPMSGLKRAFSLGRYDVGHGRFVGGTSTTQRSMSEFTGLERFSSNSRMNQNASGGGFQFQDEQEEATRRWSSIAKRTLNWLMRREKKPPLASALGNL